MLAEQYKERFAVTNFTEDNVTHENTLSLFISDFSFIYAISSNNYCEVQQIVHMELVNLPNTVTSFTDRITYLLDSYKLHENKFQKIIISILNKNFTLIPESFSNASDLKEFLSFSTGLSQIKKTLFHTIKNISFCYAFDDELTACIEKRFTHAIIKHAGAISTELILSNQSLLSCNLVLILHDGLIEIAAKEKNDILFYNVFNYENDEDVLYYLMFMMEQFNLNPLHIKLAIAGQVKASDTLLLSIKKYIKHVNFASHNNTIVLKNNLSELPLHFYFTLLNQHLCV